MGKEIDRVKRERAQKSSRTTPQELQAQLETKRQNAINSIKEASPEELEGGNVSPFSTNYGNKYISGISREDVELKVNSANALELEELGFGPPPTTGMTIVEEVPLFGETSSSQEASGFGQENNTDAKKAERIISASFTGQGTTLEIEIRGEKRDFLLTWNRTNTNPILWGNKREDGSYTTTDVFPSKEDVQRLVDKYIPSKLLNLINEWTNASKLPAGKVLDAQAIAETKINAEIEQIKKTSSTQQSQEPPVRRIPKSKKTKTVLDIGIANISKSEIESKIQENKDHHKDNCNGIIPF